MPAIEPDFYSGKRVVVTGGRGFLGRFVTRLLGESGATAIPLGRSDYNLAEQADVRRMYAECTPDIVIHLAAAVGGIGANVANPGRFLYENGVMGLMLLEEARKAEIDKFVLISTICSYPRDVAIPLREETLWDGQPVGATGPYGMAKRLLHEAVRTFGEQYDTKGIVLVPTNLFGPEDHFDPEISHVIPAMIRRYINAREEGVPKVVNWGSGNPTREFLFVRDAARAIVMATALHDDPAPMNIGTGVETSIRELAETIAELTGYEGEVAWDPTKPDGQPARYMDVSKAREAIGFQTEVSLRDGLAETIDWFLAHGR